MSLPWPSTRKVGLMRNVELMGNGVLVVDLRNEVLLVGVGRGIMNRV